MTVMTADDLKWIVAETGSIIMMTKSNAKVSLNMLVIAYDMITRGEY